MTKKNATYLVCVNGEEYSRVAFRFASYMAHRNNGALVVLHVTEPADYQSFGAVADKMREEKRQEAEKLLQSLAEMASKELNLHTALMLREGMIDDEIISVIEEDDSINMIIMGAPTEGAPKSKIIGPLVSQASQKLQVPMMVVPGSLTLRQIKALT